MTFPGSVWDKNVQSTANDGTANPSLAQGADYNEMADEVEAIQIELSNLFTNQFTIASGVQLRFGNGGQWHYRYDDSLDALILGDIDEDSLMFSNVDPTGTFIPAINSLDGNDM